MSELSSAHIKKIFDLYGVPRHYESGTPLANEGDECREVCFITKGEVRAYCAGPDGNDVTLFYIGAGNMIFSEALMEQPAYILRNSQTITPVDVLYIDSGLFLEYWQKQGYPIRELFTHFVERFQLLHEYICCAHFKEGDKRVAYLLYTASLRMGKEINITHEQIASITGINRVSVSRILNRFVKEGIITQGYKKIVIINPKHLCEVFDSLGINPISK